MEKRTVGIIATFVTVLLCGCPGLVSLFGGIIFAIVSRIPGADIDIFGSNDPASALNFGIGGICLGVFLIVIPLVVGILTLRNKPTPAAGMVVPPNEPLPPAI